MLRLGKAAGDGAYDRAPEQQAISKHDISLNSINAEEVAQLASTREQLAAKEAQLQALSDSLTTAEQALLAAQQPTHGWAPTATDRHRQAPAAAVAEGVPLAGLAAGVGAGTWAPDAGEKGDSVLAARWRCLAERRAELVVRWQCLLEEKRQLSILLQQQRGKRGGGEEPGDFEPGRTPVRDVTCAVITHQLDTPCFSCCFQR